MLCPLCDVEMVIGASRTCVEGDQSPATATRVYIEQDLVCTTPQCPNHNKVVEQRRAYLVGEAQ